jgi:hypothetical protein
MHECIIPLLDVCGRDPVLVSISSWKKETKTRCSDGPLMVRLLRVAFASYSDFEIFFWS